MESSDSVDINVGLGFDKYMDYEDNDKMSSCLELVAKTTSQPVSDHSWPCHKIHT